MHCPVNTVMKFSDFAYDSECYTQKGMWDKKSNTSPKMNFSSFWLFFTGPISQG